MKPPIRVMKRRVTALVDVSQYCVFHRKAIWTENLLGMKNSLSLGAAQAQGGNSALYGLEKIKECQGGTDSYFAFNNLLRSNLCFPKIILK